MTSKKGLKLTPGTDAGNAELFALLYGDCVRFDHKQGRWLIWDDRRWSEDTTNRIQQLMKRAARKRHKLAYELLRDEEGGITDEGRRQVKWALDSENNHRIKAALSLAESEVPISDDGRGWDADSRLFGVANGIVDLRTGKLRPELPEDHITKHSPIAFDEDARCPRFEQFFDQVFEGNEELKRFVQKAIGYTLTGEVSEQCLFACYGSGANGKSTLLGVLHHVFGLGNYAANLPFSALELQNRNHNDLVMLPGTRFATAIETREGVRLNEQRIKALTGGDPLTAKRLYHEQFTFWPTHKLWLAFNHKPRIDDDSSGMWRRLLLIPFNREFRREEQDKELLEKLKAEAPGILAWAVRGCLLWQREGLGRPPAVVEASAAYRSESDHLEQFLDDHCVRDSSVSVLSSDLWSRYKDWVAEVDEVPLSIQDFADRMKKKGFTRGRDGTKRTWEGVGLADAPSPQLSEPRPEVKPRPALVDGGAVSDFASEVEPTLSTNG